VDSTDVAEVPVRRTLWTAADQLRANSTRAPNEYRLRRGTFKSVPDLIDAIETWVEHWNDDPKPFVWHKTAEEIITKVRRGRAALAQVKSATDH